MGSLRGGVSSRVNLINEWVSSPRAALSVGHAIEREVLSVWSVAMVFNVVS